MDDEVTVSCPECKGPVASLVPIADAVLDTPKLKAMPCGCPQLWSTSMVSSGNVREDARHHLGDAEGTRRLDLALGNLLRIAGDGYKAPEQVAEAKAVLIDAVERYVDQRIIDRVIGSLTAGIRTDALERAVSLVGSDNSERYRIMREARAELDAIKGLLTPFESDTAPFVRMFGTMMEAQLAKNREKGDRTGWMKDSLASLHVEMMRNLREFDVVISDLALSEAHSFPEAAGSRDEAARRAVNVANFLMMLVDKLGQLRDARHQ